MIEGQTFVEVFQDYTVPKDLKYVLSNAVVSKVVMKQQTRELVIHLKSEYILQRKLLNKVAYDMKKELFGRASVFILFDDTYELSSAYTLEKITSEYWNSILYEMKKMGRVEYSLLSNAEWGFEGNIMTILLEDSFLAKDKSRKIKEYLEELFLHRFGKEIQVGFDFTDDAKQAFYQARNHKLNLEVDMVMSQIKQAEADKKAAIRQETLETFALLEGTWVCEDGLRKYEFTVSEDKSGMACSQMWWNEGEQSWDSQYVFAKSAFQTKGFDALLAVGFDCDADCDYDEIAEKAEKLIAITLVNSDPAAADVCVLYDSEENVIKDTDAIYHKQ